jgi:hypothetical protein
MRPTPLFVYACKTSPNLSPNKMYKVTMLDGNIPTIKDNQGRDMIIDLDRPDKNDITWIKCNVSVDGC